MAAIQAKNLGADEAHATPMQEEYQPGHMRRLVIGNSDGRVYLDIRHRYTTEGIQPERWSVWERWGEFPDAEKALNTHEWVRANGPWWRSGMPENWTRPPGSSRIITGAAQEELDSIAHDTPPDEEESNQDESNRPQG